MTKITNNEISDTFGAKNITQNHWHKFEKATGKTIWWRNKNRKYIISDIEFIRTCEIYKMLPD